MQSYLCDNVINSIYKVQYLVAKGGFSLVFKTFHKKSSLPVAIKQVKKTIGGKDYTRNIEREHLINSSLAHENLVLFFGKISGESVDYFIFEFIEGRDLFDKIKIEQKISETDACMIIRYIFRGLEYIHQQNIIHRDLKPDNILIKETGSRLFAKIADFGLAIQAPNSHPSWYGAVGTPGYIVPEILMRLPYTFKVDKWSCGVMLHVVLFGFPYFWNRKGELDIRALKPYKIKEHSEGWNNVSFPAKDLFLN